MSKIDENLDDLSFPDLSDLKKQIYGIVSENKTKKTASDSATLSTEELMKDSTKKPLQVKLQKRVLNLPQDDLLLRPITLEKSGHRRGNNYSVDTRNRPEKKYHLSTMNEKNLSKSSNCFKRNIETINHEKRDGNLKLKAILDSGNSSEFDSDTNLSILSDLYISNTSDSDDEFKFELKTKRHVSRRDQRGKQKTRIHSKCISTKLELKNFLDADDVSEISEEVTLGDDTRKHLAPNVQKSKLKDGFSTPGKSFKSDSSNCPIEESKVKAKLQKTDSKGNCLKSSQDEQNEHHSFSKNSFFKSPTDSEFLTKSLVSPKKIPRIPKTPHRPSTDAFWQQEIINEWNDEYSPPKKIILKPETEAHDPTARVNKLTKIQTKRSVKLDKSSRDAKKLFSEKKHSLAESFLHELDDKITQGEISKLADPTGGVKIQWSKKLNSTAGRANWKRETIRPKSALPDGSSAPVIQKHYASIELAEKVIDDEDRLLNVIAHEFCHLANFMISNVRNNPHGREFKVWAAKCSQHFGHRGIHVTTKHSYAIDYKYIWECENCGLDVKRHSKSVDPARHVCGTCKSRLVQIKPVPRTGGTKSSEYQKFVRENMKKVRENNPGSPQKEIMTLVGKQYQEFKATRLKGESEGQNDITDNVVHQKNDLDTDMDLVSRKLEYFDLTSS